MSLSFLRGGSSLALVFALAGVTPVAAQTNSGTNKSATPGQKSGTNSRGAARGPLPDPAILDGASHPAEKRSEHGMVGDFELPGDENARNNRVGGQQQPQPGGGGPQVSLPGVGLPLPIPAAGGMPAPPSGGSPGLSIPQLPDPLAKQGGGAGGGPENPAVAGKQPQGAGSQGGQPQGAQSANCQAKVVDPEQGQIGEKPPQVSIGDSAMQIKTIGNPASVVGGAQPAGNTQQHEKTVATGGKGAPGNNSNKGAERGRAIPAGL